MARRSDPDLKDAWRELLLDFQASQITVAEFCDLHQISTGQFYYRKRKLLSDGDDSEPSAATVRVPGFLPVHVAPVSGPSLSPVVIDLPDATRIQIPADRPSLILAVVTTLAQCPDDSAAGDPQ